MTAAERLPSGIDFFFVLRRVRFALLCRFVSATGKFGIQRAFDRRTGLGEPGQQVVENRRKKQGQRERQAKAANDD